jgi:hypothetical protein
MLVASAPISIIRLETQYFIRILGARTSVGFYRRCCNMHRLNLILVTNYCDYYCVVVFAVEYWESNLKQTATTFF